MHENAGSGLIEVEDHIDYPIVAKTHPPMYSMHKFWARKPHNVVAEYIKRYSKKGDIVFDPFCGSGVTVMEALKLGRKAVGIDLDPIATFITRCSILPVDSERFEEAYREIDRKVRGKLGTLYETVCSKCRGKAELLGVAWNNDVPFERVFVCPKCGRIRDKLSQVDLKKIRQSEKLRIRHWYPKDAKLPPLKKEKLDYVHELFTKRNLKILSEILKEIDSLPDDSVKKLLKFVFTSSLAQTTNMMPYVHESVGKICKGWTTHSYWVPPKHWELNVFEYFGLRFREILRGKKHSNKFFSNLKEARNFEDLLNGSDYFISTSSALELINDTFPKKSVVPERSVHYVFTDPPYGGSIQYFELSVLWASWLRIPIDSDDEITINRFQKKDFERYDRMLRQAFRQTYRTLVPNRHITVTFHNTQIRIRNSLIRAVVFAGFDMEKIVYQPPAVVSAKARLQPYGSAIGDYYIRFKKPRQEKLKTEVEIDKVRYETVIVETVKRILAERGEPTSYSYLLNFVDVELERNGLLLGAKTEIKDVLRKYEGKEFVLVDMLEGLVKGKKWWLKDPSSISFLERIPLNERVEKAVIDVLKRKDKAAFDDILQTIFTKFPNSLTPESHSVKHFLETYALKTKDKRWRLNPDFIETERLHQTFINILAELGVKAGFKVWVAHKDDTLKNIVEEELALPLPRLNRVKQIDVLWIEGDQVRCEFEVENTTQITDAVVRGGNIPYAVKRYIVIPQKRERMLKARFEEPLLKERIQDDGWLIITYDKLLQLHKANKRKKSFDSGDLNGIARMPKAMEKKQQTLTEFS